MAQPEAARGTMSFDLERARQETPGCHHVLHFNNAGAGLMPQPVLDSLCAHLRMEAEIGGYEAATYAQAQSARTYDAIAELLGCSRAEIALFDSATRAWNMAFGTLPLQAGDRILIGDSEYGSNVIALLQASRRSGAQIEVIPSDASGQISLKALERALDSPARLIALTHVPTNGGLIQPAREVGQIARAHGTLYLLDACQSVGQMPVSVADMGCDLLTATGRKYLRGPRGTGFLYVRKGVLEAYEPPSLDMRAAEWVDRETYIMRSDARRFETWETNVAGFIGLGVAVDYALCWGLAAIQKRIVFLAERLRDCISAIPGLQVCDLGNERCGIVTFTASAAPPETIKIYLAERKINVSISPQSSTRLNMEARGLESLVRASVHYYNSEEEIQRFCEALAALQAG